MCSQQSWSFTKVCLVNDVNDDDDDNDISYTRLLLLPRVTLWDADDNALYTAGRRLVETGTLIVL